jgi:hypothetical protein
MKEIKKLRRTAKVPDGVKQEEEKLQSAISTKYIEDIQNFHLVAGDIIIIRYHKRVGLPDRQQITNTFGKLPEVQGHFVMGMDSDVEFSTIPEADMNEHGWYKKVVTWKQLKEITEKDKVDITILSTCLYMAPILVKKNFKDAKIQERELDNKQLMRLSEAGII